MPDIRILSETLSNKIAAGEVVARPASVVKELIENSLDARSSLITLEIENGGRSLIRVSDNGTGMAKDNALLSIERFATSKIQKDEDLFSIATMGFRGEALPSIASVSKFTLVTRSKDEDSGTNMIISGGKLLNVTETGAPIGTMVEVKNLFFNTPARKKFLKTTNTEMSHIADTFASIALGNKYIGFRFFNNGKLVKSFTSSDSLNERAIKVLGKDLSANLLELDNNENSVRVTGFISSPVVTRSSSRMIKIFVNNRLVNDRGIVSAILNGYKG
ncbi:MAG: DNA mismatch repair endonuclease MutL, partial [Desulfobacteraceae bacterium]|nr:DNA mismatch repair endonuclease MutL [Desulfobacteraceae bacterium]